jgi:hypothetical protein
MRLDEVPQWHVSEGLNKETCICHQEMLTIPSPTFRRQYLANQLRLERAPDF